MSRPHEQPPPTVRKTSAPWGRLRPVRQDPLEAMGFVSKGDRELLDIKAQDSFWKKIVARWMDFCKRHGGNLNKALAAVSLDENGAPLLSSNETATVARTGSPQPTNAPKPVSQGLSASKWASDPAPKPPTLDSSKEISTILTALRKLRQGLRATSLTADSPVFSQRVHVFNIRLGILVHHPQSYHFLFRHLLDTLHTKEHPLPESELNEMITYAILDLALRQDKLNEAYTLKHKAKEYFGYNNRHVNGILRALVSNNWVVFWKIWREVDGHVRALMQWHIDTVRADTLKVFSRAYHKTDLAWLLKSATGNEMSWDELVKKENVGWELLHGDAVVIRKPKPKPKNS